MSDNDETFLERKYFEEIFDIRIFLSVSTEMKTRIVLDVLFYLKTNEIARHFVFCNVGCNNCLLLLAYETRNTFIIVLT